MEHNETHPFLEILKSFNLRKIETNLPFIRSREYTLGIDGARRRGSDDMILAFCLSILVGLLLGALVYIMMTWASRKTASARITRRSKRKSTQNLMSGQLGLYRSTFLSVYRQPSVEPVGPLGSKPGAETSTFRPLPKRSRPTLDMGEDTQIQDETSTTNSDSAALVPNKRHSFWLGSNGLKGFLPSQTPPPAYDSVIHAYEETCT